MNQAASVDAHRFPSLDAWRGVCALIVAATHIHTTGYIHSSLLVQRAGRFVDFSSSCRGSSSRTLIGTA